MYARSGQLLADGTKAFDDLRAVVDKLSQTGMTNGKATQLKESLTKAKQYLKGDYKVECITCIFILTVLSFLYGNMQTF